MMKPSDMAQTLVSAAKDRWFDPGDPYAELITEANFRRNFLKFQDAGMIIQGAVLEELARANGNGKRRGQKVKAVAVPVSGGVGGVGIVWLLMEMVKSLV